MTIRSDQLRIPGKNPVRASTTTNVSNLSGGAPTSPDNVTLVVGERVLVAHQTTASQNGLYKVTDIGTSSDDATWERAKDADMAAEDQFYAGVNVYIQEGDTYGKTISYLVTTGNIVIGTDDLEFVNAGTIVRSDASGQAMTGVGTSGSPATYSSTYTTQSDSSDLRDYSNATWAVYITNKDTATSITVKVEFSEDDSNFGSQRSESIVSGASTQSVYEATFSITGETATFMLPLSLRVMMPKSKVSIKSDAGSPQGYITIWRQV